MPTPPAHHRLVADGDGPPVLIKEARGPDGVGRLGAEAAVLRALDHPGVVRLVGLEVDGEVARLSLAWVGPHTLATVTGVPVREAATIIAAVADTVADLHRAGLRHGRLTPDHILLGPQGTPVLTGLAEARALGGPAGARSDTAALGALLTTLVGPSETAGVIPERRRGRRGDEGHRAALLTLADRAQDAPDDEPLSPDELASRIRRAIGGHDPAPRRRPRRARRPNRRRRPLAAALDRRGLLAGALGAIVLASAGASVWLRPDGRGATAPRFTVPTTTAPVETASTSETGPTTAARPATTTTPPCPPTSGPTVADVDGDGCPDDVSIRGERVTVDGTTWVAGRPGDTAVVGDWDCDGTATVASLRPSSGEVFVFPRWVGSGEDLTVAPVARVAGARGLRAVTGGDGCQDLVAVDPDGGTVVVEVAA